MRGKLKKLGVSTVYLFGSRASGKAGPLSDYDIGIILCDTVSESKYFDVKLKLMFLFTKYFKHPDVEVVILNNAPPLLGMNVIDGSKILFDFDKANRVDLETKITMKYLDRLPCEERYFKTLIQSL